MNLFGLANQLKDLGQQVEGLARDANLPDPECSLNEALQRLHIVFGGDEYVSIGLDVNSHRASETPRVVWKVYANEAWYEASTLAAAVSACLASNCPIPEAPVKNAQEIINAAVAAPY